MSANLHGKHHVDPAIQIMLHNGIDIAVAVHHRELTTIGRQQVTDLPIARRKPFFEQSGRDNGAMIERYIFPVEPQVYLYLPKGALDCATVELSNIIDHFLHPHRIVHTGDGNVLKPHPVPKFAEQASTVELHHPVAFRN